jgi:hypothetical protein
MTEKELWEKLKNLSEIQRSSIFCYIFGYYTKETPDNWAVLQKAVESALNAGGIV